MHALKELLKKILPKSVLNLYHYSLARFAAFLYGNPSQKLVVIGVTGTNGKSTTTQFIGRILEALGHNIGWTTTAGFKIGNKEWENDKKMTMLGRFQTQKMLSQMVKEDCVYAIVETSSQGIAQYRHIGIDYDLAVFTNLTPEHIEAHGSFENYRAEKAKLFQNALLSVINQDDEHAQFFLDASLAQTMTYGMKEGDLKAEKVKMSSQGTEFELLGEQFSISPIGQFNLYNMLAAIASVHSLGFALKDIAEVISTIPSVPGRLESIDEGQDFTVLVDYAYEPAALHAVYKAIDLIEHKRIIHITGSAGGGRDIARRALIGELAAKKDDIVIVANEDPYDEDPMVIINDVADSAKANGKVDGESLFRILDRQDAIDKAMQLAKKDDIVLITGKGSEPIMAVAQGKKIPWDDRDAARKALKKL